MGSACRPASDERPIDLDAYAAVVARHLGPLGVAVAAEPGDYLAKDAAILLGEVVTIEDRARTTFVGLDIGWNVDCVVLHLPLRPGARAVPRRRRAARTERVTVAGHINEASDVFAEDYPMPPVAEGDIVALLNAGGYNQAMSSTHCLRPMAPGPRSSTGRLRPPIHSRSMTHSTGAGDRRTCRPPTRHITTRRWSRVRGDILEVRADTLVGEEPMEIRAAGPARRRSRSR